MISDSPQELSTPSRKIGMARRATSAVSATASEMSSFRRSDSAKTSSRSVTRQPVKEASVVFISPTQHGKSTTIDNFYEAMTGARPSASNQIALGDGTLSCTKSVTKLQPCSLSYLTVKEWPTDQEACRELSRKKKDLYGKLDKCADKANLPEELSDELYDLRHEDMLCGPAFSAGVKPGLTATVQRNGEEHRLSLHIFDTPGLDDSSGHSADDAIMHALLETMQDCSTPDLCAFVFVAKAGQPWSGSFLQSARRYWDQFPGFRRNWIFIHTRMDAFAEEYNDASCFEEACERRRKHLVEVLREKFTEDVDIVAELPHIFLENVGVMSSIRPVAQKKAEFQMAELARAFNTLVGAFCSNQLIPVQHMEYRKSGDNLALDAIMKQLFVQRSHALRTAISSVQNATQSAMQQILDCCVKSMQEMTKLAGLKDKLARLDSEVHIIASQQTAAVQWYFWGSAADVYTLTCHCAKEGVMPVWIKNQGFPTGVLEEISFAYNIQQQRTEWKVRCSAEWCRGYEFNLKLMGQRRFIFHEEVAELKRAVAKSEEDLQAIHERLQELRGADDHLSATAAQYEKLTKFFADCTVVIGGQYVDLNVWSRIAPFYRWAATKEGKETFGRPGGTLEIIEKFCEMHNLLETYREISDGIGS